MNHTSRFTGISCSLHGDSFRCIKFSLTVDESCGACTCLLMTYVSCRLLHPFSVFLLCVIESYHSGTQDKRSGLRTWQRNDICSAPFKFGRSLPAETWMTWWALISVVDHAWTWQSRWPQDWLDASQSIFSVISGEHTAWYSLAVCKRSRKNMKHTA